MQRAGCQLPTTNVFNPARADNIFSGTDLQFCGGEALSLPCCLLRMLLCCFSHGGHKPATVPAMPHWAGGSKGLRGLCHTCSIQKMWSRNKAKQCKTHSIATVQFLLCLYMSRHMSPYSSGFLQFTFRIIANSVQETNGLTKLNRREESSKESLNQHVGSTSISRTSQRLNQKSSRASCSLSCGNKAWWLVISACRVIPWFFTPEYYRCFRQRKPLFLLCLLKAHKGWCAPNPDCYSAALVKTPEGHHVKLWSYNQCFCLLNNKILRAATWIDIEDWKLSYRWGQGITTYPKSRELSCCCQELGRQEITQFTRTLKVAW